MDKNKQKLEILKTRMENQIEKMMDTIIEIDKIESDIWPWRHLTDWHEVWASMIFCNVLFRNCWDLMKEKNLTKKQRSEYISMIGDMTHNHYKAFYWFDSRKMTKKNK